MIVEAEKYFFEKTNNKRGKKKVFCLVKTFFDVVFRFVLHYRKKEKRKKKIIQNYLCYDGSVTVFSTLISHCFCKTSERGKEISSLC